MRSGVTGLNRLIKRRHQHMPLIGIRHLARDMHYEKNRGLMLLEM
jgi:hypothetical protein